MLDPEEIEALQRAATEHRLVSVTYNGGQSLLAPYTTFSRRNELYLRAITVARDGREPSRLKLGTFKLAGLSDLQVTPVPFSAAELYRAAHPEMAAEERRSRGRGARAG